ncbi:MAG: glutamate formimidoyltransferase [Desulfobacterales bacterium]|nr:MAG: glutamate formimidoyltransferase [Desulfobacterales bacterium]
MEQFVHAVPNFSDGSRKEVIEAIVDQLRGIDDVKLVAYYPDPDFNRTVVEVIGKPDPLKEALLHMAGKAYELINMAEQRGAHPRIGAQDTVPLFPLANITLAECVALAEEIGQEIYRRYKVPVYFCGDNARNAQRKSLDFIRKGQYEGLKKVVHLPERAPDIGPAALHPTAGATIVSAAQTGLVAVNVILDTQDVKIAKAIAQIVRGPSGGFTTIRAIGLALEDRDQVAVSMNMFDTVKTPIYRAFKVIELEARRFGVPVVGTQIVGTLPQEALIVCAEYFLKLENFNRDQIIENHLIGL